MSYIQAEYNINKMNAELDNIFNTWCKWNGFKIKNDIYSKVEKRRASKGRKNIHLHVLKLTFDEIKYFFTMTDDYGIVFDETHKVNA